MTTNNKGAIILGYAGIALFVICITWISLLKLKKFNTMKLVHPVFIFRWGSFVVFTAFWMLMIQTLMSRSIVLSIIAGAIAAAFTLINLVVNFMPPESAVIHKE